MNKNIAKPTQNTAASLAQQTRVSHCSSMAADRGAIATQILLEAVFTRINTKHKRSKQINMCFYTENGRKQSSRAARSIPLQQDVMLTSPTKTSQQVPAKFCIHEVPPENLRLLACSFLPAG